MPGNPKDSEWFSTPKERRKRKGIEITISDDALERLTKLADDRKVSRSVLVEALIMATPLRAVVDGAGAPKRGKR